MPRWCLVLALVASLAPTLSAQSAPTADVAAVRQAAFAYIDALYQVDTTLVVRFVEPKLSKQGFWKDEKGVWHQAGMSYADLITLTKQWNREGKEAGPGAVREAEVIAVMDQIAVAKVRAVWGTDFLHLVRRADGWKILQIIWQSNP